MHVLAEPRLPLDSRRQPPPLLEEGDRLDSTEFMRRYERMPGTTAELIDRTVHIMASPVRTTVHAQPLATLTAWLGLYVAKHPDLLWGTDGTVVLNDDHTVQPDLFLMLPPERGGRARLVDGYVHGAPELVIEVAASTASLDANAKAAAYAAAGVGEYLLFRTDDDPAPASAGACSRRPTGGTTRSTPTLKGA